MQPKDINKGYGIPYGTESQLVRDYKEKFGEYIIEIKIYRIPIEEYDKIGFKYSLVLIKNGIRIIGFDNHENKGPHVHIFDKAFSYEFVNENKLISDFYEKIRGFIQ